MHTALETRRAVTPADGGAVTSAAGVPAIGYSSAAEEKTAGSGSRMFLRHGKEFCYGHRRNGP